MKHLLCLIFFLTLSQVSFGDIIPENSHSVDKCVKIINASDFPGMSFIACIKHPAGGLEAKLLNPGECIDKGYKFNILEVFAVKKSYLLNKNPDSIDWMKDPNCFRATIRIEPYGGYADNTDPVSSVEEYYKVDHFTDTSMILYKCKEIIKFSNGRPVSIKCYAYKAGVTTLDIPHSTSDEPSTYSAYLIFDFLKALLWTMLIETLVLFVFFKTVFKKLQIKNKLIVLTGSVASFSTLPYLWFVLPVFIPSTLFYILIGELSVVLMESLIICGILKITYTKALMVSFTCNLVSFIFGLFVHL